MANQPDGFACFVTLFLGEVGYVLSQVSPIVAHRVVRVVAEFVDGFDAKPSGAQVLKKLFVGAGWKAVAVGKNNGDHAVDFNGMGWRIYDLD
jgi:hypothetical protein